MGIEILGRMACPECGRDGAIIKMQKNGRLYRFCADGCQAQFFARNAGQESAMKAAMGPVTGTGRAEAKPEAKPEAKRGFSLGGLTL